jgi:hypothetical protein
MELHLHWLPGFPKKSYGSSARHRYCVTAGLMVPATATNSSIVLPSFGVPAIALFRLVDIGLVVLAMMYLHG